jgi:hypothetical protein
MSALEPTTYLSNSYVIYSEDSVRSMLADYLARFESLSASFKTVQLVRFMLGVPKRYYIPPYWSWYVKETIAGKLRYVRDTRGRLWMLRRIEKQGEHVYRIFYRRVPEDGER